MQNLPIRVFSAAIFIALVVASYYFLGVVGLSLFCGALAAISIVEFDRIALESNGSNLPLRICFAISCIALLALAGFAPAETLGLSGPLIAFFISLSLWVTRNQFENEKLLSLVSASVLGIIYCGFFPGLIIRTLVQHTDGLSWFIFVCLVAPASDIFAYFSGIAFGKTKLMPKLSPGKTIAGSVGGCIGSLLVGFIAGSYFIQVPIWYILSISLLASFCAQSGDLFESLIKRVAGVKDSGRIMPGHGGALDRLDAIYFAGPIVYLAVVGRSYLFG